MTIRPAYRPKIVKKRTKRFIRHQSDRYAKLAVSIPGHTNSYLHDFNLTFYLNFFSQTGVSQRVLITESVAVSRVNTWCQTLVMVQTNVPVICYQLDSRNSWYTTSKNWRCWWCKIACTAARSHTVFHRKSERKSLNVLSNCPFVWQIQMVDWDHKKTNKRCDDTKQECSVAFFE